VVVLYAAIVLLRSAFSPLPAPGAQVQTEKSA